MENLPREKRPGEEVEPPTPSWLADEWLNNSFLFYQLYWSQTIAQTCLEGVDTKGTKGAKDYYEGVNGLESRGVLRDGPLEKLWGRGGISSRRNFFRYQIPCMNFFLGHSMNIF